MCLDSQAENRAWHLGRRFLNSFHLQQWKLSWQRISSNYREVRRTEPEHLTAELSCRVSPAHSAPISPVRNPRAPPLCQLPAPGGALGTTRRPRPLGAPISLSSKQWTIERKLRGRRPGEPGKPEAQGQGQRRLGAERMQESSSSLLSTLQSPAETPPPSGHLGPSGHAELHSFNRYCLRREGRSSHALQFKAAPFQEGSLDTFWPATHLRGHVYVCVCVLALKNVPKFLSRSSQVS